MTYTFDESRPFADLEHEFHLACQTAITTCRSLRPPYHPAIWINMIEKLGAAEAARRLVISGDIQTGFERLTRAGRPELTIEMAILSPRWYPLFSDQHRAAATWRLVQAGIAAPPPQS